MIFSIMRPDINKIKIDDNQVKIKAFVEELIIRPRKSLLYWSEVTNQTPAAKIGYLGQHLASLITGVKGTRSGARGDDLEDGTEVKSCNKIDQADKCRHCGSRVMRHDTLCPVCGSSGIERKDDSKWLFSVRDEHELEQYLGLDRVLLLLMDYPGFAAGDFSDIRLSAFEIYPKEERMKVFNELIGNHYYNIYRPKADRGVKTNPMNLHPWSFQFYKCNPILVFRGFIRAVDTSPEMFIDKFVPPCMERGADMPSLPMPSCLLKGEEWNCMLERLDFETEIRPSFITDVTELCFSGMDMKNKSKVMPFLNERQREVIPLRKIVSSVQKTRYKR